MKKRLTLIIENQNERLVVRNIVLTEGKKEKVFEKEKVLEDKHTALKYITYNWGYWKHRRYEFKRDVDENFESSYRRLLFMYPTYDIRDVNDELLHAGKDFTLDTYLKSLNRKKPKKIALATIGGSGHLYFGMSNDVMALESADQELLSCGMDENYTPLLQRDVLYCDISPISGIHRIFVNGRGFLGYWDEEEYLNHRYEIRNTKYTTTEEI